MDFTSGPRLSPAEKLLKKFIALHKRHQHIKKFEKYFEKKIVPSISKHLKNNDFQTSTGRSDLQTAFCFILLPSFNTQDLSVSENIQPEPGIIASFDQTIPSSEDEKRRELYYLEKPKKST